MNLATRLLATAALATAPMVVAAPTALAHQHLSAPSGDCAADNANVPQGNPENPGDQEPGNLNNADGVEQGSENCNNR